MSFDEGGGGETYPYVTALLIVLILGLLVALYIVYSRREEEIMNAYIIQESDDEVSLW